MKSTFNKITILFFLFYGNSAFSLSLKDLLDSDYEEFNSNSNISEKPCDDFCPFVLKFNPEFKIIKD